MKPITPSAFLLLSTVALSDARRSTPASSLASIIPARRQRGATKPPVAFVNKRSGDGAPSSSSASSLVRGGQQGTGTATMQNEMFNMVKAVVGVGILSLPAGKHDMCV